MPDKRQRCGQHPQRALRKTTRLSTLSTGLDERWAGESWLDGTEKKRTPDRDELSSEPRASRTAQSFL